MRLALFLSLFAASLLLLYAFPAAFKDETELAEPEIGNTIVEESQPCPEPIPANQTLHRLVNTLPIESLVLLSPRIIEIKKKYALVLLVNSAESERGDRDEIRRLWAAKEESRMQQAGNSVVIFLVGRSSSLDEESAVHGDLLMVDVEDTYRNMVYKLEAGFRWLRETVHFDFVAKIDSDTVVHIDRLHGQLSRYAREQSEPWMACYSVLQTLPVRDKCSPWYISLSEYPHDHIPAYCNGPGYAMGRGVFEQIVERMGLHPVFEVEDAFLTGVVASDVVGEGKEIKMMEEVAFHRYTELSDCGDDGGPTLSMQSTHFQMNDEIKSAKNLTEAWNWLKNARCSYSV